MKLGKHLEDPISRNCLDRISSLPDDVLGHILSFLPIRCSVSTSILSTRWRYLFTLTTCLSFDDAQCFGHLEQNERIEGTRRFKEFVDKVLDLHEISPLQKFCLVCQGTYDASDFNRWFSSALQKGVQELHYELANYIDTDFLPDYDGFFMCETLVKLKFIHCGYYIKIPLSASLPKLKILHLELIVFFDFNSMERLLSCCELLEELTLSYCECETQGHAIHSSDILKVLKIEDCCFLLGTFEIDAPNLAYLTYKSNIGVKIVPSWKYSCSFVRAELIFKRSAYDELVTNEDTVECEHELLSAAAGKTTELRFQMDSVQIVLMLDEEEQMPDFHSLTELCLEDCPYFAWEYVTSLLDKSPQLKTVIFDTGFHCCHCSNVRCPDDCLCDSVSPSDLPLDPFSCLVQVIEVRDFCGHVGPLALMGHLLRNASVLKKLVVDTIDDLDWEDELMINLMQPSKRSTPGRISSLNGSSSACHLVINSVLYRLCSDDAIINRGEVSVGSCLRRKVD
ncbi:F-box protein At4g22280-like isoform X2 [Silene latifolia]|uniref:F-box protein At4g22280-like isoform X2 n=1 Tax=Silene latifolia TaxID=37657 RepID=UPI003D76FF9D